MPEQKCHNCGNFSLSKSFKDLGECKSPRPEKPKDWSHAYQITQGFVYAEEGGGCPMWIEVSSPEPEPTVTSLKKERRKKEKKKGGRRE